MAREVKKDQLPLIQSFELPQKVTRWSESYQLMGIRSGGYAVELNGYSVTEFMSNIVYMARCLICSDSSETVSNAKNAKFLHFQHCSRQHGYVFPEDADYDFDSLVENTDLQRTIKLSMLYTLPLPGYDEHEKCILQFLEGKTVCVVHNSNILKKKYWLGYI